MNNEEQIVMMVRILNIYLKRSDDVASSIIGTVLRDGMSDKFNPGIYMANRGG